jgi:D-xylose reductase
MLAGFFCRATTNIPRTCSSVSSKRFLSSFKSPSFVSIPARRPVAQRLCKAENRNFIATMTTNVPYVTLNDGNKMPQVGFGLWKVDNATCADTVYNAIKTGYRLFDGACGMCSISRVVWTKSFPSVGSRTFAKWWAENLLLKLVRRC